MKINLNGNGQEPVIKDQTLILVSGGVESTSMLKKLLETTEWPITAVFLNVPNVWGKSIWEKNALDQLIPILQKIRAFKYFEVKIDMPWAIVDAHIQVSLIPMLFEATGAVRMYRGLCSDDYAPGMTCWHDKFVAYAAQWQGKPTEEITPDHPWLHITKRQHMNYLGELAELTFSCQLPVEGKPCGWCKSCLMRNKE